MTPRFLRLFLALLVALAAVATAATQEGDTPRWQFKKGQVLKYLFKHKEVRTVEIGGQKLPATTEREFAWRWTVQEVDERGALMELKFDALKASITAKDLEFAYETGRLNESQIPEKKKLINFYDQVAFGKFRLRLDRRGLITELTGFTKLFEDLNDTNTVDMYGMSLRDGTLAWFLQQTLGVLPDVSLAQKDQHWKQTVRRQTEAGQITGEVEFSLLKRGKDGLTAQHRGESTLEVDMKWVNLTLRGPLKSSKLEGQYIWDSGSGSLLSGRVQANVGGTLKLAEDADMRITYEHTLELTRQP